MDQSDLRRALAKADAAYKPFVPWSAWVQEPFGSGSWDDAAVHLAATRESAPVEVVTAALDEVVRGAAVDTGAIEGLYGADRGFTLSVARDVISLNQAEVEAGLGFRRSFEAQLAGFEHALALAHGDEVFTEAAIRELHRVTCADDSTHRVLTEHGVQERRLTLGSYKSEPNHVQLANDSLHAYAPVDRVPDEMHRLVVEMGSTIFRHAHPVVQAAFAHHSFTSIHPFADGNGRVARLLASVFLLRAVSIPLWVEVADRPRYIDALGAADRGDRQPFLRFTSSVTLGLMRDLTLTIRSRVEPEPAPEDLVAVTAAAVLLRELQAELSRRGATAVVVQTGETTAPADVRVPEGASLAFLIGNAAWTGGVGIAEGADDDDRFRVLAADSSGRIVVDEPLSAFDVLPEPSSRGERRLALIARHMVGEARRRG